MHCPTQSTSSRRPHRRCRHHDRGRGRCRRLDDDGLGAELLVTGHRQSVGADRHVGERDASLALDLGGEGGPGELVGQGGRQFLAALALDVYAELDGLAGGVGHHDRRRVDDRRPGVGARAHAVGGSNLEIASHRRQARSA